MFQLKNLGKAWEKFLFEPVSTLNIAVYRILFGALVVIKVAMLLPQYDVWFGSQGTLPIDTAKRLIDGSRIGLMFLIPDGSWMEWGFLVFLGLAGVCLMLGFLTRAMSVLVWIGLCSLHHRNIMILHSGDTLMRVQSFFLMFSAAGARLSIDARFFNRKPKPMHAPWAQRLLQIQLTILYLSTAAWKLDGSKWLDGTAVFYTARLDEFRRIHIPWVFDQLWLVKIITWFTLAIETVIGPLLWFKETRNLMLLLGLVLHVGLDLTMNVPLFQWVILVNYILFIDPVALANGLTRCCVAAGFKSRITV